MNNTVKEYINTPKVTNDKVWKALDDQLHEELPSEIGGSPEEQLISLENHV